MQEACRGTLVLLPVTLLTIARPPASRLCNCKLQVAMALHEQDARLPLTRCHGGARLQDLLHIVYPGASPAQIRDLSGLAEPDAKVIIEREQAVARRMLNIAQAFAACDTDGSGALDLVEFIEAMADIAGGHQMPVRCSPALSVGRRSCAGLQSMLDNDGMREQADKH